MSFGGDYGKDTGTYMTAVKDAIAAMVAAIPEITIKDETNEFDDREFKQEYKKIYRDAEECATILTKALNELPVYYCYHIQKKIVLGKGLKIVRYKTFIKKHNEALNQSLKRKEKKRKEIVESVENVEDVEFANQFNNIMNISSKRRRVEDV
jgi:flagellar biosynthesis chaperone FliJ